MKQVEIQQMDPVTKRQWSGKVPVLHEAGPWVVTPSQNPENPGFAVTFAPLGLLAWPMEGKGARSFPRACEVAGQMRDVWAAPEMFDDATREKIYALAVVP